MAYLIVKTADGKVREINLEKDAFSIGRLPDNELALQDNLISRHHSKIVKQGKKHIVSDLKSANGTLVNKKRVDKKTLVNNDEIQIGTTTLIFKEGQPTGTTPSPTTATQPTVKAPPGMLGSEVIKSIGDMPMGYRLDAKDYIDRGESVIMAAKPITQSKDSERFFILYQLGKTVTSTTSLDEVLDITMSFIFDCIKAQRGVIMLIDKKTGKLVPKLLRDKGKSGKASPDGLVVSQTITNRVIKEKIAMLTSDALYDSRFQSGASIAQFNIRSALCVPLWEKQDIFGVIYVDNLVKTHAFTNDDLDLLCAIANQIAIRIKQEELYGNLKREALLRSNLERYHSPDVVEMIIKHGSDKKIELTVEEKDVSVVFADVQDFTTLSEELTPTEIAGLLNELFEKTTQIIFSFDGSVNKYIGDAIMAVFGAPITSHDHARNAVEAAVAIVKAVKKIAEENKDSKSLYNIRVGVNTGRVVAGNIGAQKRIEYTVLGDAVNVASRLNQHAKSNEVVIGPLTYQHVKDHFKTESLGAVKLKGKKENIQVYRILES